MGSDTFSGGIRDAVRNRSCAADPESSTCMIGRAVQRNLRLDQPPEAPASSEPSDTAPPGDTNQWIRREADVRRRSPTCSGRCDGDTRPPKEMPPANPFAGSAGIPAHRDRTPATVPDRPLSDVRARPSHPDGCRSRALRMLVPSLILLFTTQAIRRIYSTMQQAAGGSDPGMQRTRAARLTGVTSSEAKRVRFNRGGLRIFRVTRTLSRKPRSILSAVPVVAIADRDGRTTPVPASVLGEAIRR